MQEGTEMAAWINQRSNVGELTVKGKKGKKDIGNKA